MRSGSRLREWLGSLRPTSPVIAIYVLASLIGGVISFSSAAGSLSGMAIITVAATAVAAVLLLIASRLPWPSWTARPFASGSTFLLIAAAVGSVRGLVIVQMTKSLDIELASGPVAQLANSLVSAVMWLTLGALVVGARDRYRRRYRALLMRGAGDVDWDSHPSVQQVKESLGKALLAADPVRSEDIASVAEAIRREIDTNIRPLSHRLWFGVEGEEPHTRLTTLVLDAITEWTVPVRTVLVIWASTVALGGFRWLGDGRALLAAAFSTSLLAMLILLVRRWTPESVWIRLLALLGGSALVIVGSDAALRALGYPSELFVDFPLVVVLPVTLAALVVTSAAIALAESDRALVLEVAKQEAQAIALSRRQSAYLHNSLQSELTGMAMQLDQAARSQSSESTRAALERVHALLARSISEDFASFDEDPRERLSRVVEGWRGICSVAMDVDTASFTDPRIGVCLQAVEEVIANAVRHSGATCLTIQISQSASGLAVTSVSDGQSPTGSGSGLGSAVLTAVAPGGVSVRSIPGRTVVSFTIE